MQKGVCRHCVGQRNTYRCRALGTVDKNVIKVFSYKLKFVFSAFSAPAGDIPLVLKLTKKEMNYRLHLGIGYLATVRFIVSLLGTDKGLYVLNSRFLQYSYKSLVSLFDSIGNRIFVSDYSKIYPRIRTGVAEKLRIKEGLRA